MIRTRETGIGAGATFANRTALILDDSLTMRQLVGDTLRVAGFHVLEASHGQEGLDRLAVLKGTRVDVIVTDLNMPVMNGLDFIRRVRIEPRYRFTPILMLTTEDGAARKAQGKAAGATGWIVKPFRPDQLINVIQKVLPQ